MPEFRPAAGRHAIKGMAFSIEFAAPLSEATVAALGRLQEVHKNDLPRHVRMHSVTFDFAKMGTPGQARMAPQGPFTLSKVLPNGEAEISFSVTHEGLSVSCSVYSRWNEMWAKARRLFKSAADIIQAEAIVATAVLNYLDKFDWDGDIDKADTSQLLKADSIYLTPRVSKELGQWHCHQGFFEWGDNPVTHAQLINVNLDKKYVDSAITLEITTLHRCALNGEPLRLADALGAENSALDKLMDQMHAKNKAILNDVLTPEMVGKIALMGK